MAEPKTKRTGASVADFLAAVPNDRRRKDAQVVKRIMERVTGERAEMWGPTIVGFGAYAQPYADGKTIDWPIAAFSPRGANLVLYIAQGFEGAAELYGRLGKHKRSKSCLYINSLDDVDVATLEACVRESTAYMRVKYPPGKGAKSQATTTRGASTEPATKRAPARPTKRAPARPTKRAPARPTKRAPARTVQRGAKKGRAGP